MLNPFGLNDIDCIQLNHEIDPDFHYSDDVDISTIFNDIIVAAPVDNVCLCRNW